MKRLAIVLLSGLILSACNDVTEPERGLVAVNRAPANTLVNEVTITDLGIPPDHPEHDAAIAQAINELGQVVGSSRDLGSSRAFLWQGGAMTDLGTLPGGVFFTADAVNDLGQVVGRIQGGAPFFEHLDAFLWQNGLMTVIPTATLDGVRLFVNNLGQVVGHHRPFVRSQRRAFLWHNGTQTDLGTRGGTGTTANAMNDAGQIVGSSGTAGGASHAFLWQNGTMTDLGTMGGTVTVLSGINDLGQIVGHTRTGSQFRAFMWHNGITTDLGTLGGSRSEAVAVNNLGQVIGTSSTNTGISGFLWQNGVMTELPGLGLDHSGTPMSGTPTAINDRGQIVGGATTASFMGHAVLWNTLRPATPAEEVSILTSKVNALVADGTLSHGQGQSLLSKLNAASSQIARGNAKAAANVLEAFIKHVQGQVAAGLYSAATGQALIDAAQAAITRLSAGA